MIKKVRALRMLTNRASLTGTAVTGPKLPTPLGSLRSLPLVGSTLAAFMRGGSSRLHEYVDRQHKQLGHVFAEKLGPIQCVFLSNPNDMQLAFSQEGQYPVHVYPEPWRFYNRLKNVKRGIFFMDGTEWFHYRRIMNVALLKNCNYQLLYTPCERVAEELINRWLDDVQNLKQIPNLTNHLYKWSVDSVVAVLLGKNYTDENIEKLAGTITKFVPPMRQIFETTHKLSSINPHLAWKLGLPQWKHFELAVDNALNMATTISKILLELYEGGDGLLEKLIKGGIQEDESVRIITDLLLAAGDTSATAMEWILYLLAKNENIQDRIYEEIKQVNQKREPLAIIKGTMREALRLYPTAPFLNRIIDHEFNLKQYTIPANSLVIYSIYTAGRDSKYFSDPLRFWPERWYRCSPEESKNGSNLRAAVAHASIPFAIGTRSCIGKKVAEAQIHITIAKVLEKFTIKLLNKNDVKMIMRLVAVPDEPVQISLVPRQ